MNHHCRLHDFIAWSVIACATVAVESTVVTLWPDKVPGESAALPPEVDVSVETDRRPANRRVVRISNVSTPTMTVYSPEPGLDTGAAVIVCPGGGYTRLAMDIEGTEVCEWLNLIGVTGIVLKCRVPRREGVPRHVPPVQDAQHAFGLMRHQAQEFGIDPHRLLASKKASVPVEMHLFPKGGHGFGLRRTEAMVTSLA